MRWFRAVVAALPAFAVLPLPGDVGAQPAEWRVSDRPVVSIGAVDAEPEYMFSFIVSAFRTEDGRILVADGNAIRVYEGAGRYAGSFGREGEGPGEFRFLRTILPYRGDSILAADAALRRVSVFDAGGSFGRSFRNPASASLRPGGIPSQSCCLVSGTFPDGSLLVELPEFLPNTPGALRYGELTLVRVAADGGQVDTIGKFESSRLTYDASARNSIRRVHFTWPFSYAVVGDRVIGANGEHSRLLVVTADGRRASEIELTLPRVPVSGAMRRAFEDTVRARMANDPRAYEGSVESVLAGAFPDFMPIFIRVLGDSQGNLWLAAPPSPGADLPRQYNVITPDGKHVARLTLPDRSILMWIGRDEILVVETDELDVQYVRVYRIVK